ncbi:hypothetical protein Taro_034262 [Colocasia esculenta]|uniref:Uncharacterized protein n=1 Tax=Colocasia esculenta TaxID=4460 RepID=A0A843W0A3_COLES|nr:hypothetical protein [Colocasia esculenta]
MSVVGFNAFQRRHAMAKWFSSRCCEEVRRVAVWKGSCNFFLWCDDFFALGPSCNAKCECNRDEMM